MNKRLNLITLLHKTGFLNVLFLNINHKHPKLKNIFSVCVVNLNYKQNVSSAYEKRLLFNEFFNRDYSLISILFQNFVQNILTHF